MSEDLEEMLDSMFHGCAIAAYCHQIAEEGRWPPDSEATKQRFNRYYEEELARKNRAKATGMPSPRAENQELTADLKGVKLFI